MAGSVRLWRTWLQRLSPPPPPVTEAEPPPPLVTEAPPPNFSFPEDDLAEGKGPEPIGLRPPGPGISCYKV